MIPRSLRVFAALWISIQSAFLLPARGQGNFVPKTPEDIGLPGGYQNMLRAMSPLGRPIAQPALTTTPTVTFASTNPGSTPSWVAPAYDQTNARVDPRYTYLSGPVMQASSAFPGYDAVKGYVLPQVPPSYGNVIVEFVTDSASVTLPYQRDQTGSLLVSVDGVVLATTNNGIVGTAQAGAAGTVTLASGASATNGNYNRQWVSITSGTGVGQQRLITAYVGATKVASVSPNWSTNPDSTSVYAVTSTRTKWNNASSGTSFNYLTFDWNGDNTMHKYHVEFSGLYWYGCYLASASSVLIPAAPATGPPCYIFGDSFGGGTGAEVSSLNCLSIAANLMGWRPVNLSIGGSGYLNAGTCLALPDRITPPQNAWVIKYAGGTANMTFTQNGQTATALYYDTQATVQAAFNTAFGSGNFTVAGTPGLWFIIGRGSNATSTAALTFSSPGSTAVSCVQYTGDLALNLVKDSAGKVQPGIILLAMGHNDTLDTSGTFTTTLLQSTCSTMFAKLRQTYPTMTILVVGNMYLPAPASANVLAANTAIYNAVAASLPKLNGNIAFVNTLAPVAWVTGTGNIQSQAGNGNSDFLTGNDAIHPSPQGHQYFGYRIADYLGRILFGQGGQFVLIIALPGLRRTAKRRDYGLRA